MSFVARLALSLPLKQNASPLVYYDKRHVVCVKPTMSSYDERIIIRGCDVKINQFPFVPRPASRTAASIILRGPTDAYCDEMERSAHDALCAVRRVLESGRLVPGGGAVEAALSIYLDNFATTLVGCVLFLWALHK